MSLVSFVSKQFDRLVSAGNAPAGATASSSGSVQAPAGGRVTAPLSPGPDTSSASPDVPVPVVPDAVTMPASEGEQEEEATIVRGRFVPAGVPVPQALVYGEAQRQTERFRRLVETFDEDKQEPIEWAIRKFCTFFCYLVPLIVAFFIGMGAGDAFAAGQASFWMRFGIHVLSPALEMGVPLLGIATTLVFKRALRDRAAVPGFIVLALFFLFVSVLNAFVLLFLLEQGMSWDNFTGEIAVWGRSFGPLVLDLICTIYLSVANVRSLHKYLAEQRQKIQAVKDVNAVNLELDEANMRAALERVQALSEMEGKQQRMATLNEAERLTHQAVIESMKKKLLNQDTDDRGGRSRYGSWGR
ncbi:MAG TPA: hypothetical protein VKX46_09530 [Ktedonobacteraceae bacterium]|nr:hypothetical protein [Ktedonobacteraceae bacterium]